MSESQPLDTSQIVVVEIRGGSVQQVVSAKGVHVVVLDYDVEDAEMDELASDDDGRPYREIVW